VNNQAKTFNFKTYEEMKKRNFILISVVMLLVTSLVVMSCGSDDETEKVENYSELYGRWALLGYVSNGNFVSNKYSGSYLSLQENGIFNGEFCNEFSGKYSFIRDGEFHILDCFSTQVYSTDADIMFMEEQLINIRSFEIEGDILKLYYSTNDYLKFSR